MPIADLYLFTNDQCNIDVSTTVFTASATDVGYAIDNAREANLVNAWKPPDGTGNYWIMANGGDVNWLGSVGDKAWFLLAHDSRGADQTSFYLRYDSADNPAFTSIVNQKIFTSVNSYDGVVCDLYEMTLPDTTVAGADTPPQYWRLDQLSADRGGGTITSKIHCFSMFGEADVIRLSVDYPALSEGPYQIQQVFRVSQQMTSGGIPLVNKYAAPGYRVGVSILPATDAFFADIQSRFAAISGPKRAIFVQKEGLPNTPYPNLFLCRLVGLEWTALRNYPGYYEVTFTLETEPWL